MDYSRVQDRNDEQQKEIFSDVLKKPYEEIRKKVFEVLNSHNVSEQTIDELMNYMNTWIDLYDEKENIIEYLSKNMPKEQPKTRQGWEVSLPAMLDYD